MSHPDPSYDEELEDKIEEGDRNHDRRKEDEITTEDWKDMAKRAAQKANEDQRAMTTPQEQLEGRRKEIEEILGEVDLITDYPKAIDRLEALFQSQLEAARQQGLVDGWNELDKQIKANPQSFGVLTVAPPEIVEQQNKERQAELEAARREEVREFARYLIAHPKMELNQAVSIEGLANKYLASLTNHN